MAKPAARIVFLEVLLLAAGAGVVARSFWIQVLHHNHWLVKAGKSRENDQPLAARRGQIQDRIGRPLAESQEEYRVSISLNQVQDTAGLQAVLPRILGVSRSRVDDQFKGEYPYFNGPFSAERIDTLRRLPGIHLTPVYDRVYPVKGLADRVLGRLNEANTGIEGMERALDTLLSGHPGVGHFLVDNKGHSMLAPGPPIVAPIPGRDVELTIDSDMQGIAEAALRSTVRLQSALGGDVVIVDVHSGELLAVASVRTDSATRDLVSTSSAFVEPNEPGSTSKLFSVAAILRSGTDTTPVYGENGSWNQPIPNTKPRPIKDVHALSGMVTLGEAVKYSSNIAITKFSSKLQPNQQYEAIRDFGFGTLPGVGFPGEAPGMLKHPVLWVNRTLTQGSLAQGYEWEATAVQIAVGYAAIANNGVLMAPSLVREVRDDHGNVIWRHRPDTVRRSVPDSIARHLNEYLMMTEGDGGTGSKAQLDRMKVPGKTGTAKIKSGGYRPSFVGLFPERDPQLVVYVMIVHPGGGKYFGGDVAAPAVREILQRALLPTTSPLDRRWLTTVAAPSAVSAAVAAEPAAPKRASLPLTRSASAEVRSAVPDVAGNSARQAALTLERAGFQVRMVGHTRVRATEPSAGDSLARGGVVTIHADSLR